MLVFFGNLIAVIANILIQYESETLTVFASPSMRLWVEVVVSLHTLCSRRPELFKCQMSFNIFHCRQKTFKSLEKYDTFLVLTTHNHKEEKKVIFF